MDKNQLLPEELIALGGKKRILLHCCCAPCSGEIISTLIASEINPTIFFYNPNIHPKSEYLYRKNEIMKYAQKQNITFADVDYDAPIWLKKVEGLAQEEEGGERCSICFDVRMNACAKYAHENNFSIFSSTLGISRWKNFEHVTAAGVTAANQYSDLVYWDYNWRKKGGQKRMHEITKKENFYRQKYCGCIFSLRDTNKKRLENGREKATFK